MKASASVPSGMTAGTGRRSRVRPIAAASIGAMLVAIGLPLTAISASAADPAPISGTFPVDTARKAALRGHITATFAEPVHIDAATVFTLKPVDKNGVVGAAVAAAAIHVDPVTHVDPITRAVTVTHVVTLDPAAKLGTPGTRDTYTATLTGVKDAAGVAKPDKTWTFTTARSENESFVNRTYEHLFGRESDDLGATHWESELNDVNDDNRAHASNGITASHEFRSTLVDDSYARFLGRAAEPAGLAAHVAGMDRGMTVASMQSGFIASPEFFGKAGGNNLGWVNKLYTEVLHRSASTAEATAWTARMDGGASRSKVAMGFLLSKEHLGTVVDDHYRHLLGRGVDDVGRAANVDMLGRGGRDETIIGNIIASAEFFSHN